MIQKQRKRLGDLLVEAQLITEDQLMLALAGQKETGFRLGEQLAHMDMVSEQQIIEVLEFQLGIPHVNLYKHKFEPNLINIINEEQARRYQVLPIRRDGNRLMVAMTDPLDYFALDDLRISTGFDIQPAIARKAELKLAINRYYGMQRSIDQMLEDIPADENDQAFIDAQQSDESPVAIMVNQLIGQAVELEASDIHIDPSEYGTRIRFRVDGMLRTEKKLPKSMHNILVSRIKILAGLNIAEKRLPQDGRFKLAIDLHDIDLRVSCLPVAFGEKIVLRLLDTANVSLGIDQLGFSPDNREKFERMIHSAYGMILVTGPTGSGKSTTLYTALQQLNADEVNIVTVEDPVEYQLENVNQVQVNANIGLTFAASLRSILRQDPDIIMVGEIRDTETAEIALRSALTGHLVLSTLHTNDAVSAISRLMDMGLEPFLVSAALRGIVGQRLVRCVCPDCARPEELTAEQQKLFHSRGISTEGIVRGEGCSACNSTGYRGRMAIQEAIVIDERLRELITQKWSSAAYLKHIAEKGFSTMFEDGLRKAAQGLTTLEEVYRVTME